MYGVAHARINEAGCNRIRADAVRAPFDGHLIGEQCQTCLGGRVRPAIRPGHDAIDRRDIDDRATLLGCNHRHCRCARR